MNSKKKRKVGTGEARHIAHEAEGIASGAVVGAVVGAAAGPPGIVAGALIGAVAGAVSAAALETGTAREEARTRELDKEIGVTDGDLGAPNLKHPPAKVGAYSGAAVGLQPSEGESSADGPMPSPEE
jgi:hypothetical protein